MAASRRGEHTAHVRAVDGDERRLARVRREARRELHLPRSNGLWQMCLDAPLRRTLLSRQGWSVAEGEPPLFLRYVLYRFAGGSTQGLRIKDGEEVDWQRFISPPELGFAQRWRALQQDEAEMTPICFSEVG